MKKIIIPMDPEQAAIDFAEMLKSSWYQVGFSVIPKTIGANPRFWAKLVEIDHNFIASVPKVIVEGERFSELVNHNLFFEYLPKGYLTEEDYLVREANPELAVHVSGRQEMVNEHEVHVWYNCGRSNVWSAREDFTPAFLFKLICEWVDARNIFPELWSQELADMIWESRYVYNCFNAIPKSLVRNDWAKVMEIYDKKRSPLFGWLDTRFFPECLARYWSNFKDEEQMQTALRLEEVIAERSDPTKCVHLTSIDFDDNHASEYNVKFYREMWEVVEPIISGNPKFLQKFFELYEFNISKLMPESSFKMEWITKTKWFEYAHENYTWALSELKEAKTKRERSRALSEVNHRHEYIKNVVRRYRDLSEAQAEEFIASTLS